MNAYIKGVENMSLFRLSFTLENKIGMMKIISETLFTMEINIDEIHTQKISPTQTIITLGLEVLDYDYLIVDRFIERIRNLLGTSLIDYKVKEIKMQ